MIGFGIKGPVWEHPDSGGLATGAPAGTVVANGCHECECELLFAQVMQRVLRVKNMCSDDVCRVEDFRAFRRRNMAISADYARIYLQPLGEAKRLKFAGGAAFGSTHIGYGMDLAAETLEAWGSTMGRNPTDLVMPDGTEISEDWNGPTFDVLELGSAIMTGVGYEATLTGLRRLTYGNLAIYCDLGAVLWFCQLHEQRFNFFRDGRIDEFMECFDRFVEYVTLNHADDHDVYGDQGSFGSPVGGYLRAGLRALAEGNIEGSLSIIDHEQRNILENFMYTLGPGVSGSVRSRLGTDGDFASFMNALESIPAWVQGNGFGDNPKFNGLRAQFSYLKEPYRLMRVAYGARGGAALVPHDDQPLMYGFVRSVHGNDFANPDIRTPWFKEVVRHFISAERNEFDWPTPRGDWDHLSFRGPGNETLPYPSNLQELLYSDLGRIRAAG